MTAPPLPASPCLRVRCVWNEGVPGEGGIRFFLSYSGSAPTGANCTTLASDIATAWGSRFNALIANDITLNEVDVLDIATLTGLSGQWTGTETGTRGASGPPYQVCMNVEYGIARRYRGGKPRSYFPFGVAGDYQTDATWTSALITAANTGVANFFSDIAALSIGAMGTLAHVNLSYYAGFTNIANSSGRERAVPKYKTVASLDSITGYSAKAVMGSQRRRRTSTTP